MVWRTIYVSLRIFWSSEVMDRRKDDRYSAGEVPFSGSARLSPMNIEIRNPELEARLQKQVKSTGSASIEEVLVRLLETQEEQDRWLAESRDAVGQKIRRGLDQLNRGEGIPEDQLDSYLTRLKTKPE